MMRKMVSMLLAALLCLALLTPAVADGGFDMSVFDLADYELSMNDSTIGFINPNSYLKPLFLFGRIGEISATGTSHFSYIWPYVGVDVRNYQVKEATYIIKIELTNDDYARLETHTIEFYVVDVCYTFAVTENEIKNGVRKSSNGSQTNYEDIFLTIGSDNRQVMDDILARREPVKVIVYGKANTVEFVMGDEIIKTMCGMYEDFLAAGGMEICLKGLPMTVQSPLQRFLKDAVEIPTPLVDFAGKTTDEWLADDANRALLVSLMAYDLYTANPMWADVLGYTYGTCYVGRADDGAIHVGILTAGSSYYIIWGQEETLVSVQTGSEKLSIADMASKFVSFTTDGSVVPVESLMNAMTLQMQLVMQYSTEAPAAE